jgi:hypothetical protein
MRRRQRLRRSVALLVIDETPEVLNADGCATTAERTREHEFVTPRQG